MDTKSKNDYSYIWSIIAIVIAMISIVYCFSAITDLFKSRWEWSAKILSNIYQIVRGGMV